MFSLGLLRSTNVRIVILILVFTAALVAAILLMHSTESVLQGAGFDEIVSSSFEENINVTAGQADLLGLNLALRLIPPSGAGEESNIVTIQLDDAAYFIYDDNVEFTPDRLCIDAIRMGIAFAESDPAEATLAGINMLDGADPFCTPMGNLFGSIETIDLYARTTSRNASNRDYLDSIQTRFPTHNEFFRYPYDEFTLNGALQVRYRLLAGETVLGEGLIQPIVAWLYGTGGERNWNINVTSEDRVKDSFDSVPEDVFQLLEIGEYQALTFEFSRPLLFRLVFPFLILAMLLLILTLPFMNGIDSLVSVTASILFGLFGLKQLMLPGNTQGQTILDAIFLGLYVVLAFAFVVLLIARMSARRREAA